MDSLKTECQKNSPKLMSQRLPRFMRRRASSHNPKRVPKSVRQSYDNKSNKTETQKNQKKSKNKNKKYVNKKKSELSLKRRHQKKERSVLHVWFAKRFKMKIYWNCLLPEKNTTKNQRLLYHNSKNDYIFEYLSHYSCLQIDYSKSERQQLISFLADFVDSEVSYSFGAKIYESERREGMTVLYDYKSYPFKPLVSSYFLWNQNNSKLWLWIHISVYDKVFQLLSDYSKQNYSQKFQFNRKTKQLERFRLFGPKALQLLSKCFNFDFNAINLSEVCADSVHYFRSSDNIISLIESNETNLFRDNPGSVSQKKSLNCFDFILILKNRLYNNRMTFDLIVSTDSAKTFWKTFTENRGHRVGGLHDLQMIAFNTSSLLFPSFGFIDAEENKTKVEKLKELLEIDSDKDVFVIRNDSILLKLSQDLSLPVVNQVLDSIKHSFGLINVELICVDRGVPQELDPICLPTEEDIQRIVDKTEDQNTDESDGTQKPKVIERKVIGLIEFGNFSLETSRGKGLGVISLTSLKQLIQINDKIKQKNQNYKNSKIFATFKSLKSGLYRKVSLKVIDSVFST